MNTPDFDSFDNLPNVPPENADGVCWADQVGERWEAEGHAPGRIWESQLQLTPDCFAGVMVLAKEHCAPGKRPRCVTDVKQALAVLRRSSTCNGAPEEMNLVTNGGNGYRAILVVNWARIQPTLG